MQHTLSVSQFVEILNETLEFTFPSVQIEGEIAGFKVWNGRLAFFDLKDDTAIINCMLPVGRMDTPLEDGMQVRVIANPKVTQKGRLSISVVSLELAGAGAIKRAFELLRQKLESEGLFAAERKRELPVYPNSIGLISSLESAAYQDFLTILRDRWVGVEVTALHVQVQGAAAPAQIVAAIDHFNQLPEPVDTLVLTRGGGSLEDLAAFNTESVARAVAGSRTPIVVGVGHEVDTSLADLAADVRAATPTDAARLVVPDREEVRAQIKRAQQQLEQHQQLLLGQTAHQLQRALKGLEQMATLPQAKVEQVFSRMGRAVDNYQASIRTKREETLRYSSELSANYQRQLEQQRQLRLALLRTLQSFDPRAALKRGYALVRHDTDLITSIGQVSVGDSLVIQLHQGRINTEVKHVENT
ncbi:MAG: exodeoxyribonuclease VII large subunit [Candidatus Saccharimonadales bacterium]